MITRASLLVLMLSTAPACAQWGPPPPEPPPLHALFNAPRTPCTTTLPCPELRPMALFCRLEARLEERLPMPLVLRAGDVRQAEALEDKGPWRLLLDKR
jgi:hypothetical protein